jgi:hypothetical protein
MKSSAYSTDANQIYNGALFPNRIQIKLAKYILGVHKSAINIAVLGELGLYPLSIHSLK